MVLLFTFLPRQIFQQVNQVPLTFLMHFATDILSSRKFSSSFSQNTKIGGQGCSSQHCLRLAHLFNKISGELSIGQAMCLLFRKKIKCH
jgi:hypothetical protein